MAISTMYKCLLKIANHYHTIIWILRWCIHSSTFFSSLFNNIKLQNNVGPTWACMYILINSRQQRIIFKKLRFLLGNVYYYCFEFNEHFSQLHVPFWRIFVFVFNIGYPRLHFLAVAKWYFRIFVTPLQTVTPSFCSLENPWWLLLKQVIKDIKQEVKLSYTVYYYYWQEVSVTELHVGEGPCSLFTFDQNWGTMNFILVTE